MTAAVVAFACVFSMVHIGIGKFGQWYTDSDLVEQDNNALLLKENLPEGDYRVDTYKIHDNIGMWLDKSCWWVIKGDSKKCSQHPQLLPGPGRQAGCAQ